MKFKLPILGLLAALVMASVACGITDNLVNQATGGGNAQNVSTLWSDVPKMDGLQASSMDMPPLIKLLLRTVIGNLGKLNPQGQDQTTGNIDWIAFTTDKASTDVMNYYTNDRMVAAGWADSGGSAPCINGSDQGMQGVGIFCSFQKQQGSQLVQLAIITVVDDQTKQTDVFFLRLESTPTPAPTQ